MAACQEKVMLALFESILTPLKQAVLFSGKVNVDATGNGTVVGGFPLLPLELSPLLHAVKKIKQIVVMEINIFIFLVDIFLHIKAALK